MTTLSILIFKNIREKDAILNRKINNNHEFKDYEEATEKKNFLKD